MPQVTLKDRDSLEAAAIKGLFLVVLIVQPTVHCSACLVITRYLSDWLDIGLVLTLFLVYSIYCTAELGVVLPFLFFFEICPYETPVRFHGNAGTAVAHRDWNTRMPRKNDTFAGICRVNIRLCRLPLNVSPPVSEGNIPSAALCFQRGRDPRAN